MRCQMYLDLRKEGLEEPDNPTKVKAGILQQYVLQIDLQDIDYQNPLSEEIEKRQVLSINDCGIGMDREIIERYFLQIGRSFYITEDFRRNFRFCATSRFGLGFLSVFGVSDHVVVDTYKPSSVRSDGPIQLTLNGPRSYLLTEKSGRVSNGTRISVLVHNPIQPDVLMDYIEKLCRRVEFPIQLNLLGTTKTINSERPDDFIIVKPDLSEDGASFSIRQFPITNDGIEGEIYVFSHTTKHGESWADYSWAKYRYPKKVPHVEIPQMPGNLICFNGLDTMESAHSEGYMVSRVDIRKDLIKTTISRSKNRYNLPAKRRFIEIEKHWEKILDEHLTTSSLALSEDSWKYKQELVTRFPLESFWENWPNMIPMYHNNETHCYSFNDLKKMDIISSLITKESIIEEEALNHTFDKKTLVIPRWQYPVINHFDILKMSHSHVQGIFQNRAVKDVQIIDNEYLIIDWIMTANKDLPFVMQSTHPIEFTKLPNPERIVYQIHKTTSSSFHSYLVNIDHPFIKWLSIIYQECQQCRSLKPDQFSHLWFLVECPLTYNGYQVGALSQYLEQWRTIPGLPSSFYPPEINIDRDLFNSLFIDT